MMMADQKRSSDGLMFLSCEGGGRQISGGSGASSCGVASKRLKSDGSSGGCERGSISISREKKDKIGEKVAALQQLVSPFGKTDTASVLQEATGYIKFLHEQLQVLSSPYLLTPPIVNSQESRHSSLGSRGLCLVPVAYTDKLPSSNGADIWAPTNTSSPKF